MQCLFIWIKMIIIIKLPLTTTVPVSMIRCMQRSTAVLYCGLERDLWTTPLYPPPHPTIIPGNSPAPPPLPSTFGPDNNRGGVPLHFASHREVLSIDGSGTLRELSVRQGDHLPATHDRTCGGGELYNFCYVIPKLWAILILEDNQYPRAWSFPSPHHLWARSRSSLGHLLPSGRWSGTHSN